jgi:hypothetical protein
VAWWQPTLRRRLEEGVEVRVERVDLEGPIAAARALRAGEIDLALVASENLRAMVTADAVRRLDTVLPEIDGAGYLATRTALRAETLRWGASVGAEGEGTYALPVAADLVAFGVSDAAMQEAGECVAAQRPALDAWLRGHSRLRLPSGASLRRELDGWTSWDLVLASWCWSRHGGHVATVTRSTAPGSRRRWRAGARSERRPTERSPTAESMTAAPAAIAVLRSMGAVVPSIDAETLRSSPDGRRSRGGSAGVSQAGPSPCPPRGDRLTLDAMGDPAGEGERAAVGRTWGWCLGRGSSRTARAARLLMLLTRESSERASGARARRRRRDRARHGAARPHGELHPTSLDQSPFIRLEGPASLDDAESLPARTRALLLGER